MSEKEIWKDIEDYKGLYQVSNLGRVRSLERIDALGRRRKGKVLADKHNNRGYHTIALCRDGNIEYKLIHRLVATAFLNNPNNLPQVNHKDENKANNAVSNLEWCTSEYNLNYGTRNERLSKAEGRPVYVIANSGHRYFFRSVRMASELLGLDRGAMRRCLRGKVKHHHGYTFERAVKPCQA